MYSAHHRGACVTSKDSAASSAAAAAAAAAAATFAWSVTGPSSFFAPTCLQDYSTQTVQ